MTDLEWIGLMFGASLTINYILLMMCLDLGAALRLHKAVIVALNENIGKLRRRLKKEWKRGERTDH